MSTSLSGSCSILQAEITGDALGINHGNDRQGLLAWHSLEEFGPSYHDKSGNNAYASGTGEIVRGIGKYGYACELGDYPYGNIKVVGLPSQSNNYMCSLYFKPTQLLTSGTENNFVLLVADSFYGDHFADAFDYMSYPVYKGWTLLNTAITCSAGHNNDYLKFQGAAETTWFGSDWGAATLYFDINRTKDWTIRMKFHPTSALTVGQSFGLLLFDTADYLNYCSFTIQGGGTHYDYVESSIPYMTASGAPSPYIISQSSCYNNDCTTYGGWKGFNDPTGTDYWRSLSGLPAWVMMDTSSSGTKVIQGYRLQRRGSFFLKDWVFQGSMDTYSWTTLHTMTSCANPSSDGAYTSWFYFTNYTAYRYYRFYITSSQAGTYVTLGSVDFYAKDVVTSAINNRLIVRTEDLTYATAEYVTVTGTWHFEAKKRGDVIYFSYKHEDTSGWASSIYWADTSSWASSLGFGIISYNDSYPSAAPEACVDYVRFKDGAKPSTLGDPEELGRLLITYNKIDIETNVEERTDSRLWFQTNRDGFAYGTATYKWDPDQWYLLQFGFTPNATSPSSYSWWVNAKREKGLVVGSGVGAGLVIPSGESVYYFDPEPFSTDKTLCSIDEVSHWSRWLTTEEILKMLNKTSQISWHETESLLSSYDKLLASSGVLDSSDSIETVSNTKTFEWYTLYQADALPEKEIKQETISYRIQKDLRVVSFKIDETVANIFRWSSGWISQNLGCYCVEAVDPQPISAATVTTNKGTTTIKYLFDENLTTLYSSADAVSTGVYIMVSYPNEYPSPRTAWNGFRFRSSTSTSNYLKNFPKSISIYGSNLESPGITTSGDWTYLFDVTSQSPSSYSTWAEWVAFPETAMYQNYLILINSTYGATTDYVIVSEMQLNTAGLPANVPAFDTRGDVSIYTRSFDYPSVDLSIYNTFVSKAWTERFISKSLSLDIYSYVFVTYDTTGPDFINLLPDRNAHFVDPGFGDYPNSTGGLEIKEYGSEIVYAHTRVWIHHQNQGYYKYGRSDNFAFNELDFKTQSVVSGGLFPVTSGEGWVFANPDNAKRAIINRDSGFTVRLDYSDIVGSGCYQLLTADSVEDMSEILRRSSYHFNPTTEIQGTSSLEISTTSGIWVTRSGGCPSVSTPNGCFTAPFSYIIIPSGIQNWTVESKFFAERTGDLRGQYAGLMMTYENDPYKFYQLLDTGSGIVNLCEQSIWEQVPVTKSGALTDDMWMRITKSGSTFYFYWSEDYTNWNLASPYILNANPILTGNSSPSPYRCWAISEYNSNTPAWKAFNGTCSGSYDYWRSTITKLPHWLACDFGNPYIVYFYQLRSPSPTVYEDQFDPRNFELQGSNDSVSWTTLHSKVKNWTYMSCGWGPIFKVSKPGAYRYYRLYITQTTTARVDWVTATSSIAEFKLLGDFPPHSYKLDSDYLVGPIVISDRDQQFVPTTSGLVPLMTSNNAPSPYVITASLDTSNAYKAFSSWGDSSTYWNPSSSPFGQQWIQVDFGKSVLVNGVRWQWGSVNLSDVNLKASNDGTEWTSIFYWWDKWTRAEWAYGDEHYYWLYSIGVPCQSYHYPYPQSPDYLEFINYTPYRYYRFYVTGTGTATSFRLNELQFKGMYDLPQHTVLPAYTYAAFDYFKITAASGLDNILINDDWELLLDGKTPINSSTNSCITSFTEIDTSDHLLEYYPDELFQKPVFIRAKASDPTSFKVDYDPNNSYLLLSISGSPGMTITNRIPGQLFDSSPYAHRVYASYGTDEIIPSGYLMTTTGVVYAGQCAIQKTNALSYLHTQSFPASYFNGDWTIDTWMYNSSTPSGNIFNIRSEVNDIWVDPIRLRASFTSSGIDLYQNEVKLYNFPITSYTLNSWQHVAVVKEDMSVYAYYKGSKLGGTVLASGISIMPTNSGCINFLSGYTGYIDMLNWRKEAEWTTARSLVYSNSKDEIYMFTPAEMFDLSVTISGIMDVQSPVVIPVSPLPNASGVCPASGIVFDIVDDFSGVNWDETEIIIDGMTVFSGGNNMTEWYSDRGTLSWVDMGQQDGEWIIRTEASVSGVRYYDGVNRQLYPQGTVYSGSGAWGRRFTYYISDSTELNYFDYSISISVSGTDSVGYLSRFDDVNPNVFEYNYGFSFITNSNIRMDNFFLDVGESERVDVLQAMDKHLHIDLWDANYPETDIDEEACYLRFYDGVVDTICSGTWFTTYTGTGGLIPSGVVAHRLHYDAGDYNWDGHRTMNFEVHAQNNDPICQVYDRSTYQLLYGWHVFWQHTDRELPFDFDKKLPVFISVKTQDYIASRYGKSYMLWTARAVTQDLGVGLKALPLGEGNQLEVDLVANSQYLQYSEDVDVELYCKDNDGNELLYVWTFSTEDAP